MRVERSSERGPGLRRGPVEVVPIARTWSIRFGMGRWGWGLAYSAPAIEIRGEHSEPELRHLPDVGLHLRLAGWVLVAIAVMSMGGRR